MTQSGNGSASAHSLNEVVKQYSSHASALLLENFTYILYKMLKFVKVMKIPQFHLDFAPRATSIF